MPLQNFRVASVNRANRRHFGSTALKRACESSQTNVASSSTKVSVFKDGKSTIPLETSIVEPKSSLDDWTNVIVATTSR